MATLSTALTAGDPQDSLPAVEPAAPTDAPVVRHRSRRLAHQLVEGIGAQIQAQVLKPGDKLPCDLFPQVWPPRAAGS